VIAMKGFASLGWLAAVVVVSQVLAACGGDDGSGTSADELATVCAHGATVVGVDVSEFQGAIDWAAVRASGRVFGIARVSDGTQHVDPTFAANYAGMQAHGLVRGSYQFFRASEDPVAQANLLLSHVGALGPGDLPPMLDVEVTDGQSNATIDARIAAWVARIEAATGRAPLVYTGPYFWGHIGSPASLGTTLVVADWGPSCPLVPQSWASWKFWQYADNGHVGGIGGLVDLDRFDGTETELRALTGASSTTSDVPSPSDYVGIASTADGGGYWIAKGDGGMFSFGDAKFYGSAGNLHLTMPAVGVATTSDEKGYWIGASDGGLFAFGDAPFLGSMGGKKINGPVVGLAGTKTGYWLAGDDGGVYGFGNAFYGSMGGKKLNAPVSGIAATPTGHGYWLVAKDGGVFAFGDAEFHGSMGGKHLNAPVVGIAGTPSGHGYWLVGADGGMFGFGDAKYYGSMGGTKLAAPVTGMAARPQGDGYWLVAKDGGVFAFGAAGFHGRP
jgi:GH25 family lysozyme M1 (1,4-beta-N-acetylmuramidase)